jgi:hypothetical protein
MLYTFWEPPCPSYTLNLPKIWTKTVVHSEFKVLGSVGDLASWLNFFEFVYSIEPFYIYPT